jgi:hypothetical protein
MSSPEPTIDAERIRPGPILRRMPKNLLGGSATSSAWNSYGFLGAWVFGGGAGCEGFRHAASVGRLGRCGQFYFVGLRRESNNSLKCERCERAPRFELVVAPSGRIRVVKLPA